MLGKLSKFVIKIGFFIFELRHALPEIEFNYQERNELIYSYCVWEVRRSLRFWWTRNDWKYFDEFIRRKIWSTNTLYVI